jgi:hypothetical protein
LIDTTWREAFYRAHIWMTRARPGPPLDTLLTPWLAAAFSRCGSAGEARVVLRATQAALLHQGYLLHHQPAPRDHDGLGPFLTPALAREFNRTLSTSQAAAATLHQLLPFDIGPQGPGWHPDLLTVPDVPTDARTLEIDGNTLHVPDYAAVAVRAHLIYRYLELGATVPPKVPFFDPGKLARERFRHQAIAALATAGITRIEQTLPTGPVGTSWMRQRHLSLHPLRDITTNVPMNTQPTWT